MNPQRLVAAVAALAIGFGVTLVGVGLDDDDDDVVVTAEPLGADVDEAFDEEPELPADEPAEQEEATAEEPEPAEVEAPVTSEQSPQSQDAPSNPAESAPATTVPMEMEIEETDDLDDFDGPDAGAACVDVVRLPTRRGVAEFVFISFAPDSSVVLLGVDGPVVGNLPDDFDLDIMSRVVQFEEGLPVEFGETCDEDGFIEDGGPIGDGPDDGSIVPCDGLDLYEGALAIDEALAPRYGDLLIDGAPSDLLGYRFIVAAAAERAADGSFSAFFEAVESTTGAFRTECPFDLDSLLDFEVFIEVFIDDEFSDFGYDELLCNLGQLSADSRLIDFLNDEARAFDTISCEYAEEA